MKKIIVVYLALLFSYLYLFPAEDLDYLEVNKSFYGIKNFSKDDETELFNTLYGSDGLYSLLKSLKNDPLKLNEIKKYLDKIDNNSLIGYLIRDSILLYGGPDMNDDFLKTLKDYDKNNNPAIKRIIEVRENMQKYISTNFNFSTNLKRTNLVYNISLILPTIDWKQLNIQNIGRYSYMAGDDNYIGTVFISREKILKTDLESIKNNFSAKYEPALLKIFPEGGLKNVKDNDMYKIKPGEVILISENKKIGVNTFKKIYEQITVNSDKYNFQTLVIRKRFYITKNIMYVVKIQSLMSGVHVLSNKEELIRHHGFLLDTINFELNVPKTTDNNKL